MTTEPLNQLELKIAVVARAAVEAMPDDIREECYALVALNPGDAGIRAEWDGDDMVLTWVGRPIARMPRSWLLDGAW